MISKEELKEALPFANQYTGIRIPKKKGGFRKLLIPSIELKEVQREILRFLKGTLKYDYPSVFGLCSGSCVDHAKKHSNSRFVVTFDLKDAFPSTDIAIVRKILVAQLRKIYPLEAFELTKLIIQLTTYENSLPQGAPTSPFLFWLFITKSGLFKELSSIRPSGWEISCYYDNFVISGPRPLKPEIRKEIFKCVEKFGFKVNSRKIRQFDCRQGAALICGIRIDGRGRISFPKRKVRKWRGIIHQVSIETNSFVREWLTIKINGLISYLKSIYGEELPPQIAKPYQRYKKALETAKNKQPTGQTSLDRWAFLLKNY